MIFFSWVAIGSTLAQTMAEKWVYLHGATPQEFEEHERRVRELEKDDGSLVIGSDDMLTEEDFEHEFSVHFQDFLNLWKIDWSLTPPAILFAKDEEWTEERYQNELSRISDAIADIDATDCAYYASLTYQEDVRFNRTLAIFEGEYDGIEIELSLFRERFLTPQKKLVRIRGEVVRCPTSASVCTTVPSIDEG